MWVERPFVRQRGLILPPEVDGPAVGPLYNALTAATAVC